MISALLSIRGRECIGDIAPAGLVFARNYKIAVCITPMLGLSCPFGHDARRQCANRSRFLSQAVIFASLRLIHALRSLRVLRRGAVTESYQCFLQLPGECPIRRTRPTLWVGSRYDGIGRFVEVTGLCITGS